jgi:dsRNA-specific ribonuclease
MEGLEYLGDVVLKFLATSYLLQVMILGVFIARHC